MSVIDVLDYPAIMNIAAAESSPRPNRYTLDLETYSDRITVVNAVGEIDMSARTDLLHALDRACRTNTDVVLDFSAVTFMYSGAASIIVDAAERNAGRLQVFAPTRPVRMILEALGAAELLTEAMPA